MTSLLRTLNPSQNQGVTLITGENTNNLVAPSPGTDHHTGSSYYHQGPSLAEDTISRYSNGDQQQTSQIETRKHSGTGL